MKISLGEGLLPYTRVRFSEPFMSENGYRFKQLLSKSLKMGTDFTEILWILEARPKRMLENYIFLSEIGSGLGGSSQPPPPPKK